MSYYKNITLYLFNSEGALIAEDGKRFYEGQTGTFEYAYAKGLAEPYCIKEGLSVFAKAGGTGWLITPADFLPRRSAKLVD